jgi:hypothetical protein
MTFIVVIAIIILLQPARWWWQWQKLRQMDKNSTATIAMMTTTFGEWDDWLCSITPDNPTLPSLPSSSCTNQHDDDDNVDNKGWMTTKITTS